MASPPPKPAKGAKGCSEFAKKTGERNAAAPPKRFVAPPASQLPKYVAVDAAGPSGIKKRSRTVKAVRRSPTFKTRTESVEGPSGSGVLPDRRPCHERSKRHICTTCEKCFSSPSKLSLHILSHTGELPFSCDFCDKRFNSKFKLVRHNLIHSEARAFACSTCGKTFNRKDHLTNHVKVHNKNIYTCEKPNCRKSYSSLISYQNHAALHSAEEGNLQCKICEKIFSTQQEIMYHLKVHIRSQTVKSETDKKFTCRYCHRKFFTAKDVRRHLVVHTGRRDFICPHCPQKLGRKDHLVRHVKKAHPDECWRSVAMGTFRNSPLEAFSSEESFLEFPVEESDSKQWKTSAKDTDIIVEVPCLDIKLEPLEIKMEQPSSPEYIVS